jgi:putative membrane protein
VKKFLYSWIINTLAVLIAVYVVKGIGYDKPLDLIMAALALGIFNAFLRPILMFVALPLLVVTFGLFYFVINALLLYLVGYLMRPYFHVNTFWDAFWGGLVISLVSTALHIITGTGKSAFRVERRGPPPGQGQGGGKGPIIDV